MLGPSECVRLEIPIPVSDAAEPLRFAEFGFVLTQRLLGAFAIGEVFREDHDAADLAIGVVPRVDFPS